MTQVVELGVAMDVYDEHPDLEQVRGILGGGGPVPVT
jgi:hypothetical protein